MTSQVYNIIVFNFSDGIYNNIQEALFDFT